MTAVPGFEAFVERDFAVGDVTIHARIGGDPARPPVLLLHGFPQTHVNWHRIAPRLAKTHRVVCPDLRGYGDSSKPPGAADHANYAKRAMAADLIAVMAGLGHARFAVVGHDRGGRVAHRLALDHPAAVERLCVIDISPTLTMYERTDFAFAQAYWHWFFLTQPAPLPETMLGGDAPRLLRTFLGGRAAGCRSTRPRRSPNTNAAGRRPTASTPAARTIARRPASTSSTTARAAPRATACAARCSSSGANAASSAGCSTRSPTGRRNAMRR